MDDIIHVKTPSVLEQKRKEIIQLVWGTDTLSKSFKGIKKIDNKDSYSIPFEKYELIMPNHINSIVRYHAEEANSCLVIFHEGHLGETDPPFYRETLFNGFTESKCDILWLNMPLMADNKNPVYMDKHFGPVVINGHEKLQIATKDDFSYLRFFLEPILQSLNYVTQQKEYEKILMVGHSGGGWTANIYSALDERVQNTITHAGSLPLFLLSVTPRVVWGDFEQHYYPLYKIANTLDLYVMSTSNGRKRTQILNRYDSCCFAGMASRIYVLAVRKWANIHDGEFIQLINAQNLGHDIDIISGKAILEEVQKYTPPLK